MSVEIDYPTPGCVSATFPVGGTYDAARVGSFQVTANLYSSAGVCLATQPCPAASNIWSGTLTDPNPPNSDCYLTAQLYDTSTVPPTQIGNPDQVDGITTAVQLIGGGGISVTTGST
jgi:hypothetical protein